MEPECIALLEPEFGTKRTIEGGDALFQVKGPACVFLTKRYDVPYNGEKHAHIAVLLQAGAFYRASL